MHHAGDDDDDDVDSNQADGEEWNQNGEDQREFSSNDEIYENNADLGTGNEQQVTYNTCMHCETQNLSDVSECVSCKKNLHGSA